MNKVEIIARRILGWKLNRWDRWYDYENNLFIQETDFQPEHNLQHALIIVEKLEKLGYTYTEKSANEVCFNTVCASGETLSQAITNAAFELADNHTVADEWL